MFGVTVLPVFRFENAFERFFSNRRVRLWFQKGSLGACLDPKSLKKGDFASNIDFLQNRTFYLHASHFWHPLGHLLDARRGLKNLTLAVSGCRQGLLCRRDARFSKNQAFRLHGSHFGTLGEPKGGLWDDAFLKLNF